jgi:hypothetical protein
MANGRSKNWLRHEVPAVLPKDPDAEHGLLSACAVVPDLIFNYHLEHLLRRTLMQSNMGIIRSVCLAVVLASAVLGTACFHRSYKAYDPYYNDYHKWNDRESDYYHRWARETNRDPSRDFKALPQDEQEEYWKWRHTHEDEGHHHKHDKSKS